LGGGFSSYFILYISFNFLDLKTDAMYIDFVNSKTNKTISFGWNEGQELGKRRG
jgi:hypothetical protein